MNPIAIVFDLDGTLVELPVDIAAVRAELGAFFAARGFTAELRPILARIDEAAAAVAANPDEARALRAHARGILDRAEVRAAHVAPVRPGAARALARAAGLGAVGILSNNGRACVRAALRRLGPVGDQIPDTSIVTRDDAAPKPAPDGLLHLARILAPDGGVVVLAGDSAADRAAVVVASSPAHSFRFVDVRAGFEPLWPPGR